MTEQQRVTCAVCGKRYAGKVPKGGDGSALFPRRHKILVPDSKPKGLALHSYHYEICSGSFRACREDIERG
jgi:hypothetical protein